MSLLTCVQDFCERRGLPKPQAVAGVTDPQVRQIRALLEEAGLNLAKRGDWQGITFEATLTTLAAEDQGALTSIAANGFRKLKNETMWDRNDHLPVCGPMFSSDWQRLKGFVNTGPRYRYRIRGGKLLVNPVPPAGHSWAFEYVSRNWILNGSTYKERFTNDADTILLPEDLLVASLKWRWLKAKGMDYADEFAEFEFMLRQELGEDGSKPMLTMDTPREKGPGIFIPQGNWNV